MTAETNQVLDLSVFDEARGSLQETAKWIVAAAAVVGSVLLAGLQLTDIGPIQERQPLQLLGALGGFGVGLTGVGYILIAAARVLTTKGVTLSSLSRREVAVLTSHPTLPPGTEVADCDPLLSWIDERRNDLLPDGLASILEMRHKKEQLENALAGLRRGQNVEFNGNSYSGTAAVQELAARLDEYTSKTEILIDAAQLYAAQRAYTKLIRALWIGGTLIVVGLLSFTFSTATAPPKEAPVTSPTRVDILISAKAGPALDTAKLPRSCAGQALTGVAVGGTHQEPVVTTRATPRCPAAQFKVTKELGLAIPSLSTPSTSPSKP